MRARDVLLPLRKELERDRFFGKGKVSCQGEGISVINYVYGVNRRSFGNYFFKKNGTIGILGVTFGLFLQISLFKMIQKK